MSRLKNRSNTSSILQVGSAKKAFDKEYIAFSFRYIVKGEFKKLEKEDKIHLLSKFYTLGRITWKTAKENDKHSLGYEKINSDSIKSIPAEITKDAKFIAFRFHDKTPMVGFRVKEIFNIVWLDTKFIVYKHN